MLVDIVFDGRTLTLDQLRLVADGEAKVVANPSAEADVERSYKSMRRAIRSRRPIYGATRGVGPLATTEITEEAEVPFNQLLIESHAVSAERGTMPQRLVRAVIGARVNGLLRGDASASPALLRLLIDMLNRGVHPDVSVPTSSVGGSDLSVLAEIGLVVTGRGYVTHRGQRRPARVALEEAGLAPLELRGKEALALISAPSYSLGAGALAVGGLARVLSQFDVSAAISIASKYQHYEFVSDEALAGRPTSERQSARRQRSLLHFSDSPELRDYQESLANPSRLSFRCASQVHGAVEDVIVTAQSSLEALLNAPQDNPRLLSPSGHVVQTGNFDTTRVALSFDQIRLGVLRLIAMACNRVSATLEVLPDLGSLRDLDLESSRTTLFVTNVSRAMVSLQARAMALSTPTQQTLVTARIGGIDDYASFAPTAIELTSQICRVAQRVAHLEVIAASLGGTAPVGKSVADRIRREVREMWHAGVDGDEGALQRLLNLVDTIWPEVRSTG